MVFHVKYSIMKTSMAVILPKHVDVIIDVVTDVGAVPTTSTCQTMGVNRFDVRRDIIIACVG